MFERGFYQCDWRGNDAKTKLKHFFLVGLHTDEEEVFWPFFSIASVYHIRKPKSFSWNFFHIPRLIIDWTTFYLLSFSTFLWIDRSRQLCPCEPSNKVKRKLTHLTGVWCDIYWFCQIDCVRKSLEPNVSQWIATDDLKYSAKKGISYSKRISNKAHYH